VLASRGRGHGDAKLPGRLSAADGGESAPADAG
jgi:hypothetical protein